VETKARALEDYHAPAAAPTSDSSKDASGKAYGGDQSGGSDAGH
jgi:hypothetical protein